MEQDFDIKHWTNPCPKYDCRKEACKCGLKFVSIPAVLGDDSDNSDVAPKNGLYCNAIVRYEVNGHIYIYSKEGIPVLMNALQNNECKNGLVVRLPNGMVPYPAGSVPINLQDVLNALEGGRTVFFEDRGDARTSIYTVTSFEVYDGRWKMKVDSVGIPESEKTGFWVVSSDNPGRWDEVTFYREDGSAPF